MNKQLRRFRVLLRVEEERSIDILATDEQTALDYVATSEIRMVEKYPPDWEVADFREVDAWDNGYYLEEIAE